MCVYSWKMMDLESVLHVKFFKNTSHPVKKVTEKETCWHTLVHPGSPWAIMGCDRLGDIFSPYNPLYLYVHPIAYGINGAIYSTPPSYVCWRKCAALRLSVTGPVVLGSISSTLLHTGTPAMPCCAKLHQAIVLCTRPWCWCTCCCTSRGA